MTTVEELTVEVEDLRQKNERLQRINAVRLAKFDLIRSELQYYIMGNSEKDELIGELQARAMLFIAKDIYDRVLNYSKPGFNKSEKRYNCFLSVIAFCSLAYFGSSGE